MKPLPPVSKILLMIVFFFGGAGVCGLCCNYWLGAVPEEICVVIVAVVVRLARKVRLVIIYALSVYLYLETRTLWVKSEILLSLDIGVKPSYMTFKACVPPGPRPHGI
jgi:hypothetical protein